LCENYLQEHYDVQKCKKCHTILYRELKPDKTATIQFKAVCPVCAFDSESKIDSETKSKLEKRGSIIDRVLCSGEVIDTKVTKEVKSTTTTQQVDVLPLTTSYTEEKKRRKKRRKND